MLQNHKRLTQRTAILPSSIPIPQVNLNTPGFAGVNSTTTGSLNGSSRLMLNAGITTDLAQVASTSRTKVIRAGTPSFRLIVVGWKPASVTETVADCPSGSGFRVPRSGLADGSEEPGTLNSEP